MEVRTSYGQIERKYFSQNNDHDDWSLQFNLGQTWQVVRNFKSESVLFYWNSKRFSTKSNMCESRTLPNICNILHRVKKILSCIPGNLVSRVVGALICGQKTAPPSPPPPGANRKSKSTRSIFEPSRLISNSRRALLVSWPVFDFPSFLALNRPNIWSALSFPTWRAFILSPVWPSWR